ncbi:hypothetical protein [Bradyrhizobium oligotrophicum]|uniref:hypothetical protein n=1 Tax=Bradyrhizobium oligotrophicum TaxID=44255 RepID=UPI003EBB6B6B
MSGQSDEDDQDRDIVRRAVEALDVIDKTFENWLIIGEAFERGRQWATREARTNVPKGRGYNEAFSRWMKRYEAGKLTTIDQAARYRLGKIMENRQAVVAWRQTLTSNQLREWSHPTTVWRRFEAAHNVPDDDAPKKPSHMAQLKESLANALDDNQRLQERMKHAEGSLFDLKRDSAEAIADTMVRNVSDSKAEAIAGWIRKKLKEKKKPAG